MNEKDIKVIERYTIDWNNSHGEKFDFIGNANQEELFSQIGSYVIDILEKHGYIIDTKQSDDNINEIANMIVSDTLEDYWYDLAIRLFGYKYTVSTITVFKNNKGEKVWNVEGKLYMDDNDSGLAYNVEFNHAPNVFDINDKLCNENGILTDNDIEKLILKRCINDYRIKSKKS